MAVETVLSIVESITGGGTVSRLLEMSSAEYLAYARATQLVRFSGLYPSRSLHGPRDCSN